VLPGAPGGFAIPATEQDARARALELVAEGKLKIGEMPDYMKSWRTASETVVGRTGILQQTQQENVAERAGYDARMLQAEREKAERGAAEFDRQARASADAEAALRKQIADRDAAVQAGMIAREEAVIDLKNSKIDPERYWKQKDGPGIFLAIASMVLGAVASGLSGKPNMALKALQQQMDKDIELQKHELAQKQAVVGAQTTALGVLRARLGDAQQAEAAYRNFRLDQEAARLRNIDVTGAGQQAQAAQQQMLAGIEAMREENEQSRALTDAQQFEAMQQQRMMAMRGGGRPQKKDSPYGPEWRVVDKTDEGNVIFGWGIAGPKTSPKRMDELRDQAAEVKTYNETTNRIIQLAGQYGASDAVLPTEVSHELEQLNAIRTIPIIKEVAGAAVSEQEEERLNAALGGEASLTGSVLGRIASGARRHQEALNRGFQNRLESHGVRPVQTDYLRTTSGETRLHVREAPPQQPQQAPQMFEGEAPE
jgi:hypothetical protein